MTGCDDDTSPLVHIDEAVELALKAAREHQRTRHDPHVSLPLWDAHGHVLAQPVLADRDTPPFDRAAMDGYAFRAMDSPGTMKIVGEAPAGSASSAPVGAGEALAIMTGAPMPAGADTVEMLERCAVQGQELTLKHGAPEGQHIARRGEDVRAGEVAVPAGRVIQGATVGVIASVGAERVSVYRPPRVTVMATGNELVPHTSTPAPHQIRESNRHTVLAMLRSLRAVGVDGGIISDDKALLRDALRSAQGSDVIAISGGVSKGKYDLVKPVLEELGMETLFHGVKAKPGKPLLLGRLGTTLVLGLPGNPVSTYVMSVLVLLPLVRTLAGLQQPGTRSLSARVKGSFPKTGGRTTFHPALLWDGGGEDAEVAPIGWRGSGDLTGYSASNCLVRLEAHQEAVHSGDTVRVLLCG